MPPIATLPLRDHYGEWWNYIGAVLVEKLRESQLEYISQIPDSQIIYGFTEEPLSYPNIYVIPMNEPGSTPTTGGDVILAAFSFWILVEQRAANIIDADDSIRLIVGDILAVLLKDRTLTYNTTRTLLDLNINGIDADYLPSEDELSILRYHRIIITAVRKLDLSTVTT